MIITAAPVKKTVQYSQKFENSERGMDCMLAFFISLGAPLYSGLLEI
jgi:hypothetical protein